MIEGFGPFAHVKQATNKLRQVTQDEELNSSHKMQTKQRNSPPFSARCPLQQVTSQMSQMLDVITPLPKKRNFGNHCLFVTSDSARMQRLTTKKKRS